LVLLAAAAPQLFDIRHVRFQQPLPPRLKV